MFAALQIQPLNFPSCHVLIRRIPPTSKNSSHHLEAQTSPLDLPKDVNNRRTSESLASLNAEVFATGDDVRPLHRISTTADLERIDESFHHACYITPSILDSSP